MHVVVDDFASESLLRAVSATWPRDDWPHWHRYQDEHSSKLASRDAHRLPDAARLMISDMARIDVRQFGGDAFPDLDLHGARLHSILPGGHLGLHLNGAVHPLTGWRREVNAVLFVEDWQTEWGGALEFWSSPDSGPHSRVEPQRNRLVLFATGEQAWHRVCPVTGPRQRRTLSLFWWSLTPTDAERDRARFVHVVT